MRNITTAIFRNPVIVTTKNGMRPASVRKTMTARIFTLPSGMVEQPHDPDAQTVANLNERATADAASVRDDVDAVLERACQRKKRAGCQLSNLRERHFEASQLEHHLHRKVVQI